MLPMANGVAVGDVMQESAAQPMPRTHRDDWYQAVPPPGLRDERREAFPSPAKTESRVRSERIKGWTSRQRDGHVFVRV